MVDRKQGRRRDRGGGEGVSVVGRVQRGGKIGRDRRRWRIIDRHGQTPPQTTFYLSLRTPQLFNNLPCTPGMHIYPAKSGPLLPLLLTLVDPPVRFFKRIIVRCENELSFFFFLIDISVKIRKFIVSIGTLFCGNQEFLLKSDNEESSFLVRGF